jgi:hypothetical protein
MSQRTRNSHLVTNQHYSYRFSRLLLSVSGVLAKCHHKVPRSRRCPAIIIFKTCIIYSKACHHQVCKYLVIEQPHTDFHYRIIARYYHLEAEDCRRVYYIIQAKLSYTPQSWSKQRPNKLRDLHNATQPFFIGSATTRDAGYFRSTAPIP